MMSHGSNHVAPESHLSRKTTKSLLEKKRRARINKYLDQLKSLVMSTLVVMGPIDWLKVEGENIVRLEKADILEVTLRHLQGLQNSQSSAESGTITENSAASDESRWVCGFGHCAAEAYRFLSALSGEDADRVANHLVAGLQKRRRRSRWVKPNRQEPVVHFNVPANLAVPFVAHSISVENQTKFLQEDTRDWRATRDTLSFNASVQSNRNNMEIDVTNISQIKDLKREHAAIQLNAKVATEANSEIIDVEHIDEVKPIWRPW